MYFAYDSVYRGFGPSPTTSSGPASGSNNIPVPPRESGSTSEDPARDAEKEARKLRKAERAAKREAKRLKKEGQHASVPSEDRDGSTRDRERSRSPQRSSHRLPRKRSPQAGYDESEREAERERNRRAWDANAKREVPGSARWGK